MPRLGLRVTLPAVFLLFSGLIGPRAAAQSAAADSTSLDRALERLAAAAEVSLVYDAELVTEHEATCAIDASAPEATLKCLLAGRGLDFVRTSGGTYVVKEDVRKPPQHGTVKGVVRGAGEGRPLSRAHVRVADGGKGTVTDDEGRFRLPALIAGTHTLVVSYLGYERKQVAVTVPPSGVARPTVELAPTSISVDPVVVDAPAANRLASRPDHETLSPEQLADVTSAGTPSVAHAAGRLMGVTTQAPYADLHVQGGAGSAHEVRLDGVPVRNPATTGRLLGAFSPLALDGLTARKAGFGALRGNALSGVIELEHDLQRRDVHYGIVQVDPVSLNGRGEGSVEIGDAESTIMGAGRLGLWNVHQAPALSSLIDTWSVLDPVLTAAQVAADTSLAGGRFQGRRARPRSQFHDLHGAIRTDFGSTHRLYVSGYHGRSTLGVDLRARTTFDTGTSSGSDADQAEDPVSIPSSDHYEWTNTVVQGRYSAMLDSHLEGTLQASLSRYRATSQYDVDTLAGPDDQTYVQSAVNGWRASNAITEAGVEGTVDVEFSGRKQLTLLGSATATSIDVRFANAFVGGLRHADRSTRYAVAAKGQIGLAPFTTLDGSMRITARSGDATVYVEPRAALRYERPRTAVGDLSARVSGGLYRRYTTQFELSRDGTTAVVPTVQAWMPVPEDFAPPRTYHLATDLGWAPHPSWTIAAEGYAKWQPHLLAVDYPSLRDAGENAALSRPDRALSESRGRVYGGDVQLSYEGDGGTGTLQYAYTHARRTFPGRFGERMVPPPWNEPHRLTLEGRVPLGNGVALNAQGTGTWGRSWGYRRGYYAYLSPESVDEADLDVERPGDHVLPPLYRVDASLVASHSWGHVEVTGRIGLVNVFDRANVADWGLRPTEGEAVTRWPRTLPGRRSVVSLQIRY